MTDDDQVVVDLDRVRILKSLREQGEDPNHLSRLSVLLPVIIHKQLKLAAFRAGKTIREYILQLLEQDGIK